MEESIKSKPMFTNKQLRAIIIPLVVEQMLAMTIGLADTVMVSSCGESAVSGVSIVDSINILFLTLFTALATGGSVVAAQYIGMGDKKNAGKSANQLFYVSLFVSLIFGVICCGLRSPILKALYGNVDADVMNYAQTYFLLTAASYPFIAIYNSGAALFRSMGDSKTSMLTSFLMNGLNVVGNAIFIYGCGMEVAGAALATLLSRIIGSIFITILLFNKKRIISYTALYKVKLDFPMIKKILYIGVPNGIENSIFQVGKIIVAAIVAVLGTQSITANAICANIASIQITPGMSIGVTMITVVGQCVGAGKYEEARKYIRKLMLIAYILVWITTAILFFARYPILRLYNLSDATTELTLKCFYVHAVCAIIIWPFAFALPNALRASNDVKYTMYVSLASMMFLRVLLTYVLIHFFHVSVVAVWIAMCSDWFVRALFFYIRIKGDKWTKKRLI